MTRVIKERGRSPIHRLSSQPHQPVLFSDSSTIRRVRFARSAPGRAQMMAMPAKTMMNYSTCSPWVFWFKCTPQR